MNVVAVENDCSCKNVGFMLMLKLALCGQIRAGVESLRNVRGLPWPSTAESRHKPGDVDCLDWLQDMFGFQVLICIPEK